MKVGLVLEGGGLRGIFTAGVLDVFLDEHIHIDGAIGVSAGALFGVNLPSKQKGRALRYNKKYAKDKRYMGYTACLPPAISLIGILLTMNSLPNWIRLTNKPLRIPVWTFGLL